MSNSKIKGRPRSRTPTSRGKRSIQNSRNSGISGSTKSSKLGNKDYENISINPYE